MLSPIASGTTPSDPSTTEGGVAHMEETVVSDDAVIDAETVASSVVTVHSSSDGSVFAPPEPKRAKQWRRQHPSP